jgi:hypothetical protein
MKMSGAIGPLLEANIDLANCWKLDPKLIGS